MATQNKFQDIAIVSMLAALERFIFNGFRSMIVLFLVKELLFLDKQAFSIYGSLMMFSYFTPIVGGWISDKYFGKVPSIFLGFLFSASGALFLYLNSASFFWGASLILIGRGLIRPSVLPLFSEVIGANTENRDAKFTFLYAFMNLATLAGTISCAVLGECISWSVTFLVMFIADSLALSLVLYYLARHRTFFAWNAQTLLGVPIIAVVVFALFACLKHGFNIQSYIFYISFVVIIIPLIIRLYLIDRNIKTLINFGLVIVGSVIFYMLYEQSGNSLVLFAENNINRQTDMLSFFGLTAIPTTFFQTIDPIFNLILGGSMAVFWTQLSKRGKSPHTFAKIAIGLAALAVGLFVLGISTGFASQGMVSPWFLIGGLLFFVIGELCVVPIAMSFITRIAPQTASSFYVGFWYFCIGIAQYCSGRIATLSTIRESHDPVDLMANLHQYFYFFNALGFICLGFVVVIWIMKSRVPALDLR